MEKGERKHGCCVRESGMTQGLSRERLGKRGSTREKRARNHSPLDREETLWHKTASTRRDGGIGRRSGLKIRRWQHLASSSLAPGTIDSSKPHKADTALWGFSILRDLCRACRKDRARGSSGPFSVGFSKQFRADSKGSRESSPLGSATRNTYAADLRPGNPQGCCPRRS